MDVNLVIAVTDRDWFDHLSQRPNLAEVNFWAPSGTNFRALEPGELFLFKLHAPPTSSSAAASSPTPMTYRVRWHGRRSGSEWRSRSLRCARASAIPPRLTQTTGATSRSAAAFLRNHSSCRSRLDPRSCELGVKHCLVQDLHHRRAGRSRLWEAVKAQLQWPPSMTETQRSMASRSGRPRLGQGIPCARHRHLQSALRGYR